MSPSLYIVPAPLDVEVLYGPDSGEPGWRRERLKRQMDFPPDALMMRPGDDVDAPETWTFALPDNRRGAIMMRVPDPYVWEDP